MKSNFYIFLVLIAAGFFALSNSNGVGTVQGVDRTNSPLGIGGCQSCHNGGSFNPASTIEILNGDEVVTEYEPGQQYTMRLSSTFDGNPSEFGFQAVALNATNETAGSWIAGDGYKLVDVNGRSYTEHSPVSSTSTFDMTWIAPSAGAGDVSFFASTCTTNSNNMSGGDNGAFAGSVVLTEAAGSNITNAGIGKMELTIMPNPVSETLSYKAIGRDNGTYELRLTDAFGKTVLMQDVNLITGENILSTDVSNLPKGIYIMQVSGKNYFAAERMIKL